MMNYLQELYPNLTFTHLAFYKQIRYHIARKLTFFFSKKLSAAVFIDNPLILTAWTRDTLMVALFHFTLRSYLTDFAYFVNNWV